MACLVFFPAVAGGAAALQAAATVHLLAHAQGAASAAGHGRPGHCPAAALGARDTLGVRHVCDAR